MGLVASRQGEIILSQELTINIVAVDNASRTIVEASQKVSSSMKEVEDSNRRVVESNRQVSASSRDIVSSLSESERAQLSSVDAAQRLEIAERKVTETKRVLSIAVMEHGVASEEATRALRDYNAAQRNAASLSQELGSKIKETTRSTKELIVGFSGVATSAFSLYSAYHQVESSQVALDNANLQIKSSLAAVENAQRRLNDVTEKYGPTSAEAAAATRDLQLAQERATIAYDQANLAQNNVSRSMVQAALQIIPTSITMVDNLSRAWKNFPDMSKTLESLSSNISNVGSIAKTAAVGVGAFVGGFLLADTVLSGIPEEIRAIAGALTASISAIVAATVAWMAFHGTMTVGVAVPVILAAVGTGVAGVKAAVGMAKGGVIREPTLVLAGEAGPEIYSPLDRFEDMLGRSSGGGPQYVTIYPTINIGNISSDVDLARAHESVSYGIAEGVRRRLP
jgi:hypothetical protein